MLHYLEIPKSKHSPAMCGQPVGAADIGGVFTMLSAICFHNQLVGETGEICDERAQRDLPAEFPSLKSAVAQHSPQAFFSLGHVTAHGFRAGAGGPLTPLG
jgi:hypothetical protein